MMAFKIFLREQDTKKSYKTFILLTTHKKHKTDKVYNIRPIIDRLNESFQAAILNKPKQNIDKHMTKFKGCPSMKQWLKMKPIKWGFKWWFQYASSTGYLYEFQLYLGGKKNIEAN